MNENGGVMTGNRNGLFGVVTGNGVYLLAGMSRR